LLFPISNKVRRKYSLSLLSDAAGGFRAKLLLPSVFLKKEALGMEDVLCTENWR